jgi:LysM repeat protein
MRAKYNGPEEIMKKKKLSAISRLDLDLELEMAKSNKNYEDTVTNDFEDDDYYSEDGDAAKFMRKEEYIKNVKFKRLFFFSVGTIILCFIILFGLLASLLKKARTDAAEAPSALYSDDEVKTIIAENETLRVENEDLKNQILELTAQSRADYARPASQQTSEPDSPVEELPRKYTVKPGDTLMDISVKFYGNQKDYVKIKEANNIEGETIFAGQALIIP